MKAKFAQLKQASLFEKEETLTNLSSMGNPLEKLEKYIDFEMFRPMLEEALYKKDRKSNAGRKPMDPVFVCKALFLQRFYGLSDEQLEYQITDRMSFRRFLGIMNVDDVIDARTLWKYRDALSEKGTFDLMFNEFHEMLSQKGLIFNEGKMVDASFVEAPRQRNSREENKQIKEGKGGDLWKDKPHKKCHKDVDARWTKKRQETHFGYKQHVKADVKSKFIDTYVVTDASVHDSQPTHQLLDENDKGQDCYLDSGYVGQEDVLRSRGMNPIICEKGYRNHPLTDEQKANNRQKSKIRCRVEHIFGFEEGCMKGLVVRSVGLLRAKANVALTSLVYNVCRFVQIMRYHPEWIKI